MSLLRPSPALPRNTVLRLSPWLIVGSAVILGLAIAFWAVKNACQERENMTRNLLDRSGALIWALEGGVRAGMGMRISASHLQYLLEETAKQPGIAYMAVVTQQGQILAHNDRDLIGDELYSPEIMAELAPAVTPRWRIVRPENSGEIFEVCKIFSPLPGFREHMRHGMRQGPFTDDDRNMEERRGMGGHGGMRRHGGIRMHGGMGRHMGAIPGDASTGNATDSPFRRGPAIDDRKDPVIVVGLDMQSAEDTLAAGQRSTLFTALLVGLLGIGGLLSLFWAQSYRLSRRLLQDTKAFAAEVVGSLPLGMLILDASNRVSQTNAVAESILGQPGRELLGKTPSQLKGIDWEAVAARVGQGRSVLEEEHALILPGQDQASGQSLPVSVSASRILNDEGEALGTLFLLRDLREVKHLQEQLRRSERLSTLGNMAARVAHEIRNPLSSIKGFATFLGSCHDNAEGKEAARAMIGEVDRLNRVVSELLDFARPSQLRIAPVSLNDTLQRALRLVELDADDKGVALRFTPAPSDVLIAADAERVTQALLNLFLNAVQATPSGGTLSAAVLPPRDNRVGIEISDTGRGMSPEVLAQIFNPYFTTKATGSGLGLSIVQKLIEDHNGDVKVTSAEGRGTTVMIRLPLAE